MVMHIMRATIAGANTFRLGLIIFLPFGSPVFALDDLEAPESLLNSGAETLYSDYLLEPSFCAGRPDGDDCFVRDSVGCGNLVKLLACSPSFVSSSVEALRARAPVYPQADGKRKVAVYISTSLVPRVHAPLLGVNLGGEILSSLRPN